MSTSDGFTLARVPLIYVTGHRNPDTDSIASAIGYAELKGRLDPENEYVPVRLGDLNAQTEWVLERSGAQAPDFLPHVMLRARDVMDESFPVAHRRKPVREVGLAMARDNLDLMPIVDDDGVMVGVVTMRALARRYIRESREPESLGDADATVEAIVEVLEGELVAGGRQADRRARLGQQLGHRAGRRRRSRPATWSWSAIEPTRSGT